MKIEKIKNKESSVNIEKVVTVDNVVYNINIRSHPNSDGHYELSFGVKTEQEDSTEMIVNKGLGQMKAVFDQIAIFVNEEKVKHNIKELHFSGSKMEHTANDVSDFENAINILPEDLKGNIELRSNEISASPECFSRTYIQFINNLNFISYERDIMPKEEIGINSVAFSFGRDEPKVNQKIELLNFLNTGAIGEVVEKSGHKRDVSHLRMLAYERYLRNNYPDLDVIKNENSSITICFKG